MDWLNIFIKKDPQNLFVSLLEVLKVKHTKLFANKFYSEHPHKYNLYGLSQMLSDYQIENKGIRVKNKEEILYGIKVPFIAHTGTEFILVLKISDKHIEYIWQNKHISLSTGDFIKNWTGIALLIKANENAIEPNYKKNRKDEYLLIAKKSILIITIVILLGLISFYTRIFTYPTLFISLLFNGIGAYISYLLLLKQLHIHSRYADRICSLLVHKNDCNNILESDAAKFLGTFSWSEIGLGYFVSNILTTIILPSLYPYIALINICALPYTIWSVWYQKSIAKQWCPLCLVVQILLWFLFLYNLFFGLIQKPVFTLDSIILIGCMYIIPSLILNILVPFLSNSQKMEQITQEINSMKAHESIFDTLLKDKPKYEVDRFTSSLLMGDLNAKNMITVVTNPHCNPCAKMHVRLERLLKKTNQGFCLQYILSSFNEELETSSKLFIAIYQQEDLQSYTAFLNAWYLYGKDHREEFYKKHPFDAEDNGLVLEYERQKVWLENTKIKTTPTILFNGYELPDKYQVEDLFHFINI